MESASTVPLPVADGGRVSDAVRVQILATEHWNLLATRSTIWNEAFSRATVFLTVLSGAVVALAFVAQATAFGHAFRLFALVVLPIVLLVGLGTFIRLGAINEEDFWLVVGMNRLRHAYLELAPELEPYFVTGHHDDLPGIFQTYTYGSKPFGLAQILSGTPNIVGVIDAVVAGVIVTLIVQLVEASIAIGAVAGIIGGLVTLAAVFGPPMRSLRSQLRNHRPRFPH